MEQLKNAFYEVMYKYQKSFSEEGVMENLRSWASGKAELLALLRRHPDWNEDAKAVVIPFKEGRGIDRDVVDETAFNLLGIAEEQIAAENINAFRVAISVAVGEYSQTLSEDALATIRENAQIKCATGEKTSRIIGKICRKFGLDKHAAYNNTLLLSPTHLIPFRYQERRYSLFILVTSLKCPTEITPGRPATSLRAALIKAVRCRI